MGKGIYNIYGYLNGEVRKVDEFFWEGDLRHLFYSSPLSPDIRQEYGAIIDIRENGVTITSRCADDNDQKMTFFDKGMDDDGNLLEFFYFVPDSVLVGEVIEEMKARRGELLFGIA